jgi:hypothetical protein
VQFKFLLDRLPESSKSNSWAKKLSNTINEKLSKVYKTKAKALQTLKVYNDYSKSVLLNISKVKPRQPIYTGIIQLVSEIENIGIAKIRELMFNTIQYRDGKVISNAISENANLMGGNNTNTGGKEANTNNTQVFNPVSQQINSPSSFFFDDELPQVHEPFLPEHEEVSTKPYTLVLDLDETLVHYFDLGPDSHFLIRPG